MTGGRSIDIDRLGVSTQLNTFEYVLGELEGALRGFPAAADGGSASQEVSALAAALKAKAERAVAAEQGLSLLALDVVDRLLDGDREAAEALDKISRVNFDD